MSRFVDRGAVTAGWVGIGIAVVAAVSFLLVIPIEPIYWLLALPSGLLIGYYANSRAGTSRGSVGRIAANGVYAGLVTGIAFAVLLLAVKALFFFADDGYRDAGRLDCAGGAACVFERYLSSGGASDLAAAGVTDVASFTSFYWGQQLATAGTLVALVGFGALAGSAVFAVVRPTERLASTAG